MSKRKPIYGDTTQVTWSCGVGVVGQFSHRQRLYNWQTEREPLETRTPGGTGFVVAAFVNDKPCKAAYKAIAAAHRIVFQSPVRTNRNSGRGFFFIIYDTR